MSKFDEYSDSGAYSNSNDSHSESLGGYGQPEYYLQPEIQQPYQEPSSYPFGEPQDPGYQQPYQGYQQPSSASYQRPMSPGYQQSYQPGYPQGYGQSPYGAQPFGGVGIGPNVYDPPKNWVAALLLCLFLGGFGAHNFYLGYNGRAIAQLLLTLIGWLTFLLLIGAVLLIVVGVWVFIELMILLVQSDFRDARGRPLQR